MNKVVAFAFASSLLFVSPAFAVDDDDDDKLPADQVEKIEATLSELGCKGYEEVEVEDSGVIEIDDANCKMGTVDVKLDKDHKVMVISRD
jgi:hypothetical protein